MSNILSTLLQELQQQYHYFEKLKQNPEEPGSGEHLLLALSPTFKMRYAIDSDIILGCTIGCKFCYYRMIYASKPYIGTGKLLKLTTPDMFCEFLANSRFLREGSLIIIGARSDGVVQVKEIYETLELAQNYIELKKSYFLILRRAPFDEHVYEHLQYENCYYGTTITPEGAKLGWTPVKEEDQIRGLQKIVDMGANPDKISIEVGPINEINYNKVETIFKTLSDLGFKNLLYRGISIGSFGENLRTIAKKLEKELFLPKEYGKIEKKDHFYYLKNYLTSQLDKYIRELAEKYDITLFRHTGLFYYKIWKIKVALNRRNQVREDVYKIVEEKGSPSTQKIKNTFEELGFHVNSVEKIGKHTYLVDTEEYVTEDVAMRVGSWYSIAIIAKKYLTSPRVREVKFYDETKFFSFDHIPAGNLIREYIKKTCKT